MEEEEGGGGGGGRAEIYVASWDGPLPSARFARFHSGTWFSRWCQNPKESSDNPSRI